MATETEPAMGSTDDETVTPAPVTGATKTRTTTTTTRQTPPPSVEDLQAQLTEIAEENTRVKDALKKAREDDLRKKRRLEEFEAEDEKRKSEQLSEAEKLSKRMAELEKSARDAESREQQARTELRRQKVHREIERLAEKAGCDDPEIIPPLIESFGFAGEIEIGEDGKIVGVKDAIKKLLDTKPGLASGQAKRGTPARDTNPRRPAAPGTGQPQLDPHRQEALSSGRYNQF
jgi:hypothetical protein